MKKKLLVVLAAFMCVLLCACGSGEESNTETSQNTQNNSDTSQDNNDISQNDSETESQEKEISVVGEWIRVFGDYYQTYTFHEDGTMTGYCTEPSTYTIRKSGDKNVLTVQTGESTWEFYVVEENGSMKLNAWDCSLVPAATSGKTESSLTFPTVEQLTSDSTIEPLEFLYLIQIGLLGHKTVSFDSTNWCWNESDRTNNIIIDETHFQLSDKFNTYWQNGESFIGLVIFNSHFLYGFENMSVTTATCPNTGKDCYKLSATAGCDAISGLATIDIYLERATNQLTYIERVDTSDSNRGTWSTANFAYNN